MTLRGGKEKAKGRGIITVERATVEAAGLRSARFRLVDCARLVLVAVALGMPQARASDAVPVLVAIDAPGVTLGATADWTVTGNALADVGRFLISGTGVEAVSVGPATAASIRLQVRASHDAAEGFRELRAVGPGGISNLLVFRVDRLPQIREAEPNDNRAVANTLVVPGAVAGVLTPRDLDFFAFHGRAGQAVTIEVEARRLGAAVVPAVRLLAPSGASLARSEVLRDGTGDCRLRYVLPADGGYCCELRDALYHGSEMARYRLRIDTLAFATGLFPLGGRRAETIGDGPEVQEPPGGSSPPSAPTQLAFGATVNGRIDRPGEVDCYALRVKPGDRLCVDVQAAALGSWLDSVVTLDDSRGNRIAENDDRGTRTRAAAGPGDPSRDSRLEAEAGSDGVVVVTISDRSGDGGPEYAYRLSVGPPRPDFAVMLRPAGGQTASAATGALNLSPGTRTTLRFLVTADGRPGPISVRAEGLPPGAAAEPVLIRIPRPALFQEAPVEATLVLKVEPDARPALGWLRVVATARNSDGTTTTHVATSNLILAATPPGDPRPPPTRVVSELPVSIVEAGRRD